MQKFDIGAPHLTSINLLLRLLGVITWETMSRSNFGYITGNYTLHRVPTNRQEGFVCSSWSVPFGRILNFSEVLPSQTAVKESFQPGYCSVWVLESRYTWKCLGVLILEFPNSVFLCWDNFERTKPESSYSSGHTYFNCTSGLRRLDVIWRRFDNEIYFELPPGRLEEAKPGNRYTTKQIWKRAH